ncbi:MAG: aromatic acid exporter family protein [Lactobacillaceae bacterium]|jgi:uncharacterized membrane protein YgaE (UPF0421/DUF939 family)|nr:aromatic acid exporter family protein [Lactobacillaceae bacterium]
MTLGQFRFGKRTFKTGLAVFIVILGFTIFHRGNPMIASLAAIFSLRSDFETTIHFGKSRIIANTLGGLFAIVYIIIRDEFHNAPWVTVIVIPILLMLLIVLNDGIHNNTGIIGASAAFLMISLTVPVNETYVYAFDRVIDTFVGVAVAILMNVGTKPISTEEVAKVVEEKLQKK